MPSAAIAGTPKLFPIRRIFCVGRNYAEHARELGHEVDRQTPFYFLKLTDSVVFSGAMIPYPPGTEDCHYEGEFVVAIGAPAFRIPAEKAGEIVYGYAAGIDLTRRDLQSAAKEKGRPWDLGKTFENAAMLGTITPAAAFGPVGDQRIVLKQNGEIRQDARLSDFIWSVPELIAHLSRYYHLQPGDLLYTGTPAGVGAVSPGDTLRVEIDGLERLEIAIGAAE
ncbi:fumarylacetoacetase [Afifella sp. IM 167]|nr:fumarylacetoacetase [Afifella sp. IM 167]